MYLTTADLQPGETDMSSFEFPGPWPRRHGVIVFGTGDGFWTEYIGSGYSTYSTCTPYEVLLLPYRVRCTKHGDLPARSRTVVVVDRCMKEK